MIVSNYYAGFKTLCGRNPNISRIPSKEELEHLECDLSGMSYLVIKSGMQYNPSIVNPEIIADDNVAKLFLAVAPIADIEPPSEAVYKTCEQCGEEKEISGFRKKANKIPAWFDSCIQCQAKARHTPEGKYCGKCDMVKDVHAFGKGKSSCLDCESKERLLMLDELLDPMINISTPPSNDQYIRLGVTRDYMKRAYEMGVKDTLEKLDIREPTFEELIAEIEL